MSDQIVDLSEAQLWRDVAEALRTGGDPGVPGPAPCGCGADGDAVMWNPWNRVVQCHGCGIVYVPRFEPGRLYGPGPSLAGLDPDFDATTPDSGAPR